jgi:hypothetical protein
MAAIVIAHDGVVAERRDDARAMRRRCTRRQGCDIEVIIVAVRHKHGIESAASLRKATPGSLTRLGPIKRNGEARFDHTGSSSTLMTGGLQEEARVPNIGDAPA